MKKNLNKILLVIVCINLIFVVTATFTFATEQQPNNQTNTTSSQVYFTVSKSEINIGEEFSVSVINNSGKPVTSASIGLDFDPERFEVVDAKIFGTDPAYKSVSEGQYTLFKVQDAATPYAGEEIARFVLIAKENIAGNSSLQLSTSKIGYGKIGEMVMELPVENKEVTFTLINSNPEEIPLDTGTTIPEPTDQDEPLIPSEPSHKEPEITTSQTLPSESEEETKVTTTPTTTPTSKAQATESITKETVESEEPTEPSITTNSTTAQQPTKPDNKPTSTNEAESSRNTQDDQNNGKETEQETMRTFVIEVNENSVDIIANEEQTAPIAQANHPTQTTTETRNNLPASHTESETSDKPTVQVEQTTNENKEETEQSEATSLSTESEEETEANSSAIKIEQISSQNTKTNELENEDEKQAKQEKAFELTEEESELHNYVIMGGLAIIALGSIGALGFMVFHGNRPR